MEQTSNDRAGGMQNALVVLTFVFLVSASAFLLYSIYAVTSAQSISAREPIDPKALMLMVNFGRLGRLHVNSDTQLLLLVMMAGAMGSTLHGLRSLYWYIGHKAAKSHWLPMYLVLPFSGAVLAVGSYLLLRGGLITPTAMDAKASAAGAPEPNVYGFAALGFLVGMFSEHAVVKLKKVMETVLGDLPQGANYVPPKQDDAGIPSEQAAPGSANASAATVDDADSGSVKGEQ
jgi:hypothetical protein